MKQERLRECLGVGGSVLGAPTRENGAPHSPCCWARENFLRPGFSALDQPGFGDPDLHSSFPLLSRGVCLEKIKTPRSPVLLS